MHKPFFILNVLTLFIMAPACTTIPTSERADEVRARVMPQIEKEIAERGFPEDSELALRLFKEQNLLEVWLQNSHTGYYQLFKTYPICKFSGKLGPKLQEGDHQAPEGFYNVEAQRLNPNSKHHLSFNIGFPNEFDRAMGYTGSHLMIHGGCQSEGCYAMGDQQVEEIYMLVERSLRQGQSTVPVMIFPFPLTEENLRRYARSPWQPFWRGLKPGYDDFVAQTITPAEESLNPVMF